MLAHVRVEPVGPDHQLAGDDRRVLERSLAGATAPEHRLDPRDQLLGVARLRDPVVGAAAQRSDAVGDGRRAADHEHREPGHRVPDPLDVVEPGQRRVDDQRV